MPRRFCWLLFWSSACGGGPAPGPGDLPGAQDDAPSAVPEAAALTQDATSEAAPLGDAPPGEALTSHEVGAAEVVAPVKGATSWLAWHDGTPAGALNYDEPPDHAYEYTRFDVEQPVRLWGLRAALEVPAAQPVTLHLWDDFGGDFLDFRVDPPLASVTQGVEPTQDGAWVDFPLAAPVDLVPGRMFFAGLVVTEPGAVQLQVDAATAEVPEGKLKPSFVWFSKQPPDANGFPAVSGSPGDFLVEVEAEYLDVVAPEDRDFAQVPAEELGIPSASRLAVADVDGDGDLDVMVSGPRLYTNDGTGHFTDVTESWLPGISGHNGGVFGDFDNDGDPDYFATGHQNPADRLLLHEGDHFVDVTAASGIDDSQSFNCAGTKGVQPVPTEAAAWLDYDGDGWLDLYVGGFICWDPPAGAAYDTLWHNQSDGTFSDATSISGANIGQYPGLAARGMAPADANGDGWPDLLVTNYRLHKNLYFESLGDGTFEAAGERSTLQGVASPSGPYFYFAHSIGAVWGDIDHDADLDLFVANLAHPRFIGFSQKAALYANPGGPKPVFEDVTAAAGIRYLETPSNPNLWDMDNDGDLDLFYTCVYPFRTSQLYRNDGHPTWTEVTYPSGLAVYNGWGSVVLDMDGDGDLDLLAGSQYFRNKNLGGHGSVQVRLVGSGTGATNRDGIGGRVTATVGGRLILRERVGAHGTGVQDSPWLHLGLGTAASVDLEVSFPASGTVVKVPGVKAGARVTVREDGSVEEGMEGAP